MVPVPMSQHLTQEANQMTEATVKDVKEFFDMNANDFMKDWKALTDDDKTQLKAGIGDGTFTY